MTIRVHRGDLPDLSHYRAGAVAIDTETMGLDPHRDRLCVVQLSPGDGSADVVQIPATGRDAPNLKRLLADPAVLHLHALKDKLDVLLAREGRAELAAACFRFLPDRARLDLAGWAADDIFAHS